MFRNAFFASAAKDYPLSFVVARAGGWAGTAEYW